MNTPIELQSEKASDRLKEITDRLEQGVAELFDSDRYKEYLRVMARFHRYSFNNTLLIAMQCPGATKLAPLRYGRPSGGTSGKERRALRLLYPRRTRKS